jgi:hypothetical protein
MTEQLVRFLPTDPRDMVPSAVRWAYAVADAVRLIPPARLPAPSRASLLAITWVLAAAADFDDRIPADHTAGMLAREAGVGDRTWQKRSALLRQWGWLQHGAGGPQDGWVLAVPASG